MPQKKNYLPVLFIIVHNFVDGPVVPVKHLRKNLGEDSATTHKTADHFPGFACKYAYANRIETCLCEPQ